MKLTKAKLKQIIKEELKENIDMSAHDALTHIEKAISLLAPIHPGMIERLSDVSGELRRAIRDWEARQREQYWKDK
jgi:histone deacetylase complex regulatory component SIN3